MKKVSICICLIILPLVFLSGCESAFNPRFSLEREINLESNFPLGADLKIEVQGKNGNILLLPAADDQFKITMNMHVKASSKEEAEKIADAGIKLEQSAEGILLVIDESKINAGIKLELPPLYRFNLALGNLGGGIEIRDLFCGEINLKNKNGPLILTNILAGTIQGFTSNGSMQLKDLRAKTIDLLTSNGEVEYSGEVENLTLTTSNARLALAPSFSRPFPAEVNVLAQTTNASLELTLARLEEFAYHIRAKAEEGDVQIDALGFESLRQDEWQSTRFLRTDNKAFFELSTSNALILVNENYN